MGHGARIRCAVGAVLPRAGLSAAKSQEKTKRNKTTLSCFFPAANPLLKLFLLVAVVVYNSLTSFHVVAKTVLDSQ
jgi:hypothetical protein